MSKIIIPIALILIIFPSLKYAQFTNVAAATGTNHGNNKDGGVAWADFNNDGCLDLIFNTSSNDASNRSRILYSDCSMPNPTFTDVTETNAKGLRNQKCDRSVSVGDYNNDGYIDICRNTSSRIEVYLNAGPGSAPAYSFGDAAQNPNFVLTTIPNGMNVEGFGWMDYNNDGWLDLIVENHSYGIDIYENPADGSSNFTHVTPNGSTKGLPTGGSSGDYMALCDYNNDGFIDILARKQGDRDIWTNSGVGTFSANLTFDENAANGNKGGVLFCDFDNDGDFDLFWTDQGVNQIFEQTGINSGTFVATAEPATSAGVTISNSIDGCDCGDIDNDGDMDLFLGGSSGANSYLFTNDGGGPGVFNFTRNNMGISPGGNTEGLAFADYDNDGDLDLYINISGGANELWRNPTNTTNYFKIHVKHDVGGGIIRDDLGATIIMKDCYGGTVGGVRQVSSVKGHGSNSPAVVHFGLPFGNGTSYLFEIRYTSKSGTRTILDTTIVPSIYPNQTITIKHTDGPSVLDGCYGIILPVEFTNFKTICKPNGLSVLWQTLSEIDNASFILSTSSDGKTWNELENIQGQNNSNTIINYALDNLELPLGHSYIKLSQKDFDGTQKTCLVTKVNCKNDANFELETYVRPDVINLAIQSNSAQPTLLTLVNINGQIVYQKTIQNLEGYNNFNIPTAHLSKGFYVLNVSGNTFSENRKIVIE